MLIDVRSFRRCLLTMVAILSISVFGITQSTTAATFTELGDLPGGFTSSMANGVSADGSVVVGNSHSASGNEAFRWTESGGMVGLGDLPGGSFGSSAAAVSADGSVVVGTSTSASMTKPAGGEAYLWTEAGGMVGLGTLGIDSGATAISADGSIFVGNARSSPSFIESVRGPASGGMVELPTPAGTLSSAATGVSGDGSVVVGSHHPSGAYRWTASGGMVDIGDLPGGSDSSSARAVSANGLVVVGGGTTAEGQRAFRWTQSGGMQELGDIIGGGNTTSAYAVSADGSFVVGNGSRPSGGGAWIWDENNGIRSIVDILTNDGIDLGGWSLNVATGVSDDGLTVVGMGNHNGANEGWIVTLDAPPAPASARTRASRDHDASWSSRTCGLPKASRLTLPASRAHE